MHCLQLIVTDIGVTAPCWHRSQQDCQITAPACTIHNGIVELPPLLGNADKTFYFCTMFVFLPTGNNNNK